MPRSPQEKQTIEMRVLLQGSKEKQKGHDDRDLKSLAASCWARIPATELVDTYVSLEHASGVSSSVSPS